jgi:hypothetical protein
MASRAATAAPRCRVWVPSASRRRGSPARVSRWVTRRVVRPFILSYLVSSGVTHWHCVRASGVLQYWPWPWWGRGRLSVRGGASPAMSPISCSCCTARNGGRRSRRNLLSCSPSCSLCGAAPRSTGAPSSSSASRLLTALQCHPHLGPLQVQNLTVAASACEYTRPVVEPSSAGLLYAID